MAFEKYHLHRPSTTLRRLKCIELSDFQFLQSEKQQKPIKLFLAEGIVKVSVEFLSYMKIKQLYNGQWSLKSIICIVRLPF